MSILWEMSSHVLDAFQKEMVHRLNTATFIPSSPLQVDASLPPKGASLGSFSVRYLGNKNLETDQGQGAMQTA